MELPGAFESPLIPCGAAEDRRDHLADVQSVERDIARLADHAAIPGGAEGMGAVLDEPNLLAITSFGLRDLTYGGGRYLMVGNWGNANEIWASTDLAQWSKQTIDLGWPLFRLHEPRYSGRRRPARPCRAAD